MPARVDIAQKALELRQHLLKYNGIPAQNVDRAVHANIKYYIKNYGDVPEIKALIEEFSLDKPKESNFDNRLEEITAILERDRMIPLATRNKEDYQAVSYFFRHYKDKQEVVRLKYIYADSDCFPLSERAREERKENPYRFLNRLRTTETGIEMACEYGIFVFKEYGVLPAWNTPPMRIISNKLNAIIRHKRVKQDIYRMGGPIGKFIKEVKELGCKDPLIMKFESNW
jgi:hypothetical protein